MATKANGATRPDALPGQVVLVLQGGGALGAYQAGVYQALHEAGIEPDWVIGTSIGAINAALIAGNDASDRLDKLRAFWDRMQSRSAFDHLRGLPALQSLVNNAMVVTGGIPAFFRPNLAAWAGQDAPLGAEAASYYLTSPLQETLTELTDCDRLGKGETRLTVGAVNVRSGQMEYFDSREQPLGAAHVMASGALPPAFPAVRIGEDVYWDGGIYSNTPIEAVLDDNPRRDSVIFAVNVWHQTGDEPQSIRQVASRQKDIQYASRDSSHIKRQKQIHQLRHVIRELTRQLSERERASPKVRELASWGCGTMMHVVRLLAPRVEGEDNTKDIDFTAGGIRARWQAGYADTQRVLERAPWRAPVDAMEAVVEHLDAGRAPAATVTTERRAPAPDQRQRITRRSRRPERAKTAAS